MILGPRKGVIINKKRASGIILGALSMGGGFLVTVASNATIAAIGNSTLAGQSDGAGTAQAYQSWPDQYGDLLVAAGYNAKTNALFCVHVS